MERNVSKARTLHGDNMVLLATRLTGDPNRWRELVVLNNLKPPYITETGSDGVLAWGDIILYPYSGQPTSILDDWSLEVLTYKRDYANSGKDLIFTGPQLAITAGLENLKAALSRRLRTPIGSHPFFPLYGSHMHLHVGAIADKTRLRMACIDAKTAIMRDPRVQSCHVDAIYYQRALTLSLEVTPIPPGSPLKWEETFE